MAVKLVFDRGFPINPTERVAPDDLHKGDHISFFRYNEVWGRRESYLVVGTITNITDKTIVVRNHQTGGIGKLAKARLHGRAVARFLDMPEES